MGVTSVTSPLEAGIEPLVDDLDYDSVDDIDDADDEALLVLIYSITAATYVWAWVPRDTFADNGRGDLASYGLNEYDEQ